MKNKEKVFDLGEMMYHSWKDVHEKIIKTLNKQGIYEKDLLYRGVCVDEKKFSNIKKYKTDRSEETSASEMMKKIDEDTEDPSGSPLTKEDYEFMFNPRNIWAFPEGKISEVIEEYAIPKYGYEKNEFSCIIVYKPDYFDWVVQNGISTKIPEIFKLVDTSAVYELKKDKRIKDAVAAIFRFYCCFNEFNPNLNNEFH